MPESASKLFDGAALAARFFDSIEKGDIQGVADCYVADPRIWHNTDGKEMTLADQLGALKALATHYPQCLFKDRRVFAFEGGFVQQHTFWARHHDGHELCIPACVVARTRNGRIERLDEYLDSAMHQARADRGDVSAIAT